ncbi:hypothetical protein GR11A_00231 [Vibrio phage vB_VcorM_GR11A]|nr:hypothetical protein GR11A_00231 [Vibrio phage vB_VcorM_GR11A]
MSVASNILNGLMGRSPESEDHADNSQVITLRMYGKKDGIVEFFNDATSEYLSESKLLDPNGEPMLKVGETKVIENCRWTPPEETKPMTYSIGVKTNEA